MESDNRAGRRSNGPLTDFSQPESGAVLAQVADETSRAILRALDDGPLSASTLVERCDSSRQTVYRRINALEDAGLIDSRTVLEPNGHHCQQFTLALEAITLELDDNSFTTTETKSTSE